MPRPFLASSCVVVLALGASCGAPLPSETSTTLQPIVGEDAPDEDAVLALKTRSGTLCTGTLVGPRMVATARHCVVAAETGAIDDAADLLVVPGSTPTLDDPTIAVESVHTFDDGPYEEGLSFLASVNGRDLAALVLAEEIADIAPRTLSRGDPGDLVGEELTVVGFGPNAPNAPDSDFQRRATTFVVEVMSGVLLENRDPNTCSGDSGGPAFSADGRVLAVASFGATALTCGDETALNGNLGGVYNGVWEDVALFDDAAARANTCLPGMPERCDDLDNDCDGEVDEGCDADEAAPPPSCAGGGVGAPIAQLALVRARRRRVSRVALALLLALSAACGGSDEPAPEEPAPEEPTPDLADLLPDTVYGRAACADDETTYFSFVARDASIGTPSATGLGLTSAARIGFIRYETQYRPFFGCDCGFPHAIELFLAPSGSVPSAEPQGVRRVDVPRGACTAVRDVIVPLDPPVDVPAGFDLFVIRRFDAADEDPNDDLGAFGVCMNGCRGAALEDPSFYAGSTEAPYPWTAFRVGDPPGELVRLLVQAYPPID